MIPTPDNQHEAGAVSHLTDAFRNKANIQALARAFASEFQTVEDMLWTVINGRILSNNPTGDQLDKVGARVGEPRNGRSDSDYLAAIHLRIRVNKSQGTSTDVIEVANTLNPSKYRDYPVYTWLIETWNIANPRTLLDSLARAKAAASRGVVHYTTYAPANNFKFTSIYGAVTGAKAFLSTGAVTQPTNVGPLCSSQEAVRY